MDSKAESILKTLLYSDIFDYPLQKEEMYRFLIGDNFSKKELAKVLEANKKQIESKGGYFFLLGRKKLVNIRKNREKISILKLKRAKQIIKKVTFIPTIKFIGVSGALSMRNAGHDDDIDIFVITHKNLVWTTRFLIIIVLKFLGVYRGKNDKSYSDKICLNMIVAENKLNFDKNLYTAHEVVQLIPLFDRGETYKKLLKSNSWVKFLLPNALENKKALIKKNKSNFDRIWVFIFNFLIFEKALRFIQFNYMKRDINKEVIKDGFLGFHPFDYKTYTLNRYARKLKEYSLKKDKKN